jgi:hypothetical protein
MHPKKVIPEKRISHIHRGPLCTYMRNSFFWNNLPNTHQPHVYRETILGPLTQLTRTHFFAIFLTFVRYTTHIRVTFVQNVKKLKVDLP